MALTICQNGDQKLLGQLKTYLQTVKIYLYVNNHTPAETDTASAYTAAASMTYQTATWGSLFINSGGKAEMDLSGNINYSQTAAVAQTIYGLFGIDPSDASLVFAGAFATPITLANNGDAVQVTQLTVTLADFC